VNVLESLISGVVQGLTEFLPVSSSGHLVVLHSFFGYAEPKVLEDVLLHAGTLVAVIIFFRKDIIAVLKNTRQLGAIIAGTIPVAVAGFVFSKEIEKFFVNIKLVGIALILTGAWLFAGDLASRFKSRTPGKKEFLIWQALLVGIAQACALIPGISRSGATISTGLMLGKSRSESFSFSFLLSIPAVLGALIYKLGGASRYGLDDVTGSVLWGSAVACLTGILALWFLRKVLLTKRLYFFGIYCWIAGLMALLV